MFHQKWKMESGIDGGWACPFVLGDGIEKEKGIYV